MSIFEIIEIFQNVKPDEIIQVNRRDFSIPIRVNVLGIHRDFPSHEWFVWADDYGHGSIDPITMIPIDEIEKIEVLKVSARDPHGIYYN